MTFKNSKYLRPARDFLFTPTLQSNSGEQGGRLDFIDGLRGLTMLMVVYWHVLVMSMNVTTYTAMTLQLFRMPLFFFISGFFAYSFNFDRSKLEKRLSNRWHKQFLPTFFIFLMFIIFEVAYTGAFNGVGEYLGSFFTSLRQNGLSEFKSGYWFTFVLVEVFCIFASISYLLCRFKLSRNIQGMIWLAIAGICALVEWGYTKCVTPQSQESVKRLCEIMSLTHLTRYQVFFYLGAAARAFDGAIWKLLSRRFVAFVVLALTVTVFYFTPRFRVPLGWFYGAAITGIIFSITLFFYLRRFFASNGVIGRMMKFVGKNTLPIYLFHYFIIRIMKDMDLSGLALAIRTGAWVEIPLVVAISCVIVACVLGVDALLKIKPRIHRLIFSA
ncbi:MAG: acyltransferase [Muribaculaceae bacterium]|nr:acyltransferase [Muribaculaceae bacterium]